MTAPATNFKLGVFALAAMGSLAVAALVLGLNTGRTATTEYHTLFDESIQGLDSGAPVDYRGVRIGNVTRIEIADDRRHVDVTLAIETRTSVRLGLATTGSALRARLSSQGLTGVKFVDLDLAGPGDASDPVAPSGAPGTRYLRSQPSLAKQLEDEGARLAHSLPALVEDARATLHHLDGLLDEVHAQHMPERLATLIERARVTVDDARRLAPRMTKLLDGLDKLAGNADGAIGVARRALVHLDGDDGIAASAHRAGDAIGDLGHRAMQSTDELDQTLRDVGDAARALRAFVDELERDPEILVKGHGPARRP